MEIENEACSVTCSRNVIEENRCACVNMAMSMSRKNYLIGSVTANFDYCNKEKRDNLIEYLKKNNWKYVEDSEFIVEGSEINRDYLEDEKT